MSNIFDRMVPDTDAATEPDSFLGAGVPAHQLDNNELEKVTELTPIEVKRATQELLRYGFIEESQKHELFRLVLMHEPAIVTALEPLDLGVKIDAHRGVAFLVVAPSAYENRNDDALWAHPLVRRQRLTLEQSLLVAMLRQAFVIHEQESGVGECNAKIAVDDLLPQFATYFGDSGSDAKNESRLLGLLDQLKPYGIVSEVDKNQELTIRPLIAYLANPDSLAALLAVLNDKSRNADFGEHDTDA
jgi:hypothetical protein